MSREVIFASMPAMGTQAAMARTLSKVGLFVPSEISAAAYDNDAHAIDNLLACGVRYEVWRVDAALANTNLDNRQKIAFKRRLDEVGLLASGREEPGVRRYISIPV